MLDDVRGAGGPIDAPAPPTRADWVDARLRTAILFGELEPGGKLKANELAARWSVSATPVREALQRLAGEGLVDARPQRGVRVAEVSLGDAEELYELRVALDPLALRHSLDAAADGDAARIHRDEIRTAHDRLRDPGTDPLEAADAHRAFHEVLLSRCPSSRLRRLTAQLADHSLRYQILGGDPARRGADPLEEHARLARAAIEGRVDDAVAELTSHLQHTLDGVRALLAERDPAT